jgi:peptidoglycan/xylan/chitin deacetylase (PgdA/CDA1 family)
MIFSLVLTILGVILLYFVIEYSFLVPAARGVTVLMYHKVSETEANELSVTTRQLDRQLAYIRDKGYPVISFEDLFAVQKGGNSLPRKSMIITFDDGFKNNLDLACPLLERYGFPAIFFVTTGYLGQTNVWDNGFDPLMDESDLKKLINMQGMDIGLHSHGHINYERSDLTTVEKDLEACISTLERIGTAYQPVLAYPYGKYPRKDPVKRQALDDVLKKRGIRYGLRIGSQVNRLPIVSPYAMTRTNIRGDESFFTFTVKLKKGRAKLFK